MAPINDLHDEKIRDQLQHKAELIKRRNERRWTANFGMIASLGGVIIAPILLGLVGGGYLDEVAPQRFSWRLSGLFLGFLWGLLNAYFWIRLEDSKIAKLDVREREKDNE